MCEGSRHWDWENERAFWKKREPHQVYPWRAAHTDVRVGQAFGGGCQMRKEVPAERLELGEEWAGQGAREWERRQSAGPSGWYRGQS